jgi:hypothetical protein
MERIVWSGWRDLNWLPLDPQIGGDLSVHIKRAWMKRPSPVKQAFRDALSRTLGLDWAQVRRSDFFRASAWETHTTDWERSRSPQRYGAATSVPPLTARTPAPSRSA